MNGTEKAVATTPTARGIETYYQKSLIIVNVTLQQHLPLAVLKLTVDIMCPPFLVATTPTARGIETLTCQLHEKSQQGCCNNTYRSRY